MAFNLNRNMLWPNCLSQTNKSSCISLSCHFIHFVQYPEDAMPHTDAEELHLYVVFASGNEITE